MLICTWNNCSTLEDEFTKKQKAKMLNDLRVAVNQQRKNN